MGGAINSSGAIDSTGAIDQRNTINARLAIVHRDVINVGVRSIMRVRSSNQS